MYATACGVPKAAFTAVKFVLAKPMQDSAKQTHPWILATAQHHKSCCAEWCRNSSRHTGIKFFRIPADERSRAWLQYARRQDLAHLPPCQIYSSYRLCSAHFTSRDYADPGQTRLLRCAVPTVSIFGDGQTHVESPGSPRPANTTAMPAHSADEEVQQTEPSCSNPAGRQHKPSRCSPRTARKMKNLEKINSRLRKALSRIGKRKVKSFPSPRR
ncbi:uncharacterized protein LOC119374488 isoform X5 [Rhipicephalus sanguineus]|uniref:uncharacterized protein LOC119374488 isoform X5 n=1 Tax=Rhipicephalus sanguineus TaxID=34632 RepID=UPI0018951A85|nr:uncharacterized protein LOC119374488 isoform X5 [Rhipicephalus sanguineus]